MEESVVLTATLRDEMSAPLQGIKKDLDGTTKTVEQSNKKQAASTKESASVMETAMGKASGASSAMGTAMERASGTGKSAWGKLSTSVSGASNEQITAARKTATELTSSVSAQEAALEKLAVSHRDARHAQEQAAAGATTAQQRLDELRAKSSTKASELTRAESALSDAQFKSDRATETAQQSARDLVAGRDQLTDATKRLGDAQDIAGQKLTGFASLTEGVTQRQRDAISTLAPAVAVAGGAMTAGFGVMVKTYADFDKAMSGVQAATHETAQNMRLLREEAIRVGADTAFSAAEAAQGIEELAKAGVTTEAILNGGLAGALDLAAAGGLGVGEAAEIAATAMTQFKLEGKDIPHLADLLAAGAGKAQGSVTDLGEALKQSGLVASAAGLNIEETTGTLAAFASAGLIGSDAGTSLKTMLQRLQAPSDKAAGLMSDLGINMYDANGEFAGMDVLAGQLATSLGNKSSAERDAAMATIFGSDAVRAANVLYSQGAEGIQNWTDKVNDAGYAADTAALMQNNLSGDLEKLGGSFDTVFLKAGGVGNDAIRLFVQGLESVVDIVGKIPAPILGVAAMITGIAGGALLLGGSLITALPKILDTRNALRDLAPQGSRAANSLDRVKGGMVGISKAAGAAGVILAVGVGVGKLAEMSYTGDLIQGTGHVATALGKVSKGGPGAAAALDSVFKNRNGDGITTEISGIDGAIEKLFSSNPGDKFDRWGQTVVNSLTGIRGSKQIAEEAFGGIDTELSALVGSGNADAAAESFRQVQERMSAAGVSAQDAAYLFPQYSDALQRASAEGGGATASTEALNTALEETGVTVGGLVDDMEKFLEQLFSAGILTMDARDANAAFEEAIAGTDAAIKAATESLQKDLEAKGYSEEAAKRLAGEQFNLGAALNKTKTDFDLSTEAGRILNDQFQSVARNGMADITASAAEGMGLDGLQGKLRKTYDELINDAEGMGIMGGKADDLARKVMNIPDDANIDTWMSDAAKNMAEQTKQKVDGIDRSVNITTNWVERGSAPSTPRDVLYNSFLPGASGGAVFMEGGGVIPGYAPGVDDVPVIASRGESVLVPELTRAIGPSNIMALNHEYSGGRAAGAGPARSALSTVLGMATTQSSSSNGLTASLSSFTPASGGAVLTGNASAGGNAPNISVGQPTSSGRHITVEAGAVTIQLTVGSDANTQDIAETVKQAVAEAFEELEHDMERTYA